MLFRVLLVLGCCASSSGSAQALPTAPYFTRGREVEARQRVFTERVGRFHAALSDTVRRWAPDLLPRLDAPSGIATGYQLLPRITGGASAPPPAAPAPLVSYSWAWSEALIERETSALVHLESELRASASRRSALDSLATAYRGLVDRKRLVDADVNYNWMWQAEIARLRGVFDRNTRLQDASLRLRFVQTPAQRAADSTTVATALASDVHRVDAPAFLKTEPSGADWVITVPMVTDIDDSAFVKELLRAVSERWRVRSANGGEYRVIPVMQMISPRTLYCGEAPAAGCAAPLKGAAINVPAHLAKFPAGAAVLTTGAGSTHIAGGRAIVLSPHDAPRHMIAHEFGHVLGFQDAYVRGYRDAGNDGFVVTELVLDNADLMGSSGTGIVKASHFERLRSEQEVPLLMKAGLAALYERGDARDAVLRFQDVLRRQPAHYGAGFQLAKALDAMGRPSEAAAQWTKVLAAAELIGDSATVRQVRRRLAPRP